MNINAPFPSSVGNYDDRLFQICDLTHSITGSYLPPVSCTNQLFVASHITIFVLIWRSPEPHKRCSKQILWKHSFYLGDKFWTKHLVADVRLMNSDRGVVLVFLSKNK